MKRNRSANRKVRRFMGIQKRGPTDVLAYIVPANSFLDRRTPIAQVCMDYLQATDTAQAAAAIKMLRFLVHSGQLPPDSKLTALADDEVLKAAPSIITAGQDEPQRELAQYLGMLKRPEAHKLLGNIAFTKGPAAQQARIALTWSPEPSDLPTLAALLVQPGDPDPRGADLGSIPYSLIHAFGDQAIPALEKALSDSPYIWVRTSSAQELARKNDLLRSTFSSMLSSTTGSTRMR
jgi:hypothetical protein